MSYERNELEAAYALRDILQRNYLVRSGPRGKVREGSCCHIWQGPCNHKGYGRVWCDGFQYQVHRLMWILANNRPIPDGLFCLHHCDVPGCGNADHLFLGDHQANSDDKCQKGREVTLVGSQNGNATATENMVSEILDLVVNQRKSIGLVATKLGISRDIVSRIARGECWTHVPGPRQTPRQYARQRFVGISPYHRGDGRWTAYATADGRRIYLGLFNSEEEAARSRNAFDISQGRPPSNIIPELPEWSTPVIEEITMAQWEEMQRGPGEWVPLSNTIPENEVHHD